MTRSERIERHAAEMRERAAQARAAQFAAARALRWAADRTAGSRAPRLSPVMATVLRLMAAGHELHLGGAGFWVDTYSSEQRATVEAMRRRGWIEPVPGAERRWLLSDKGRDAAACGALGRAEGHSEVLGDGGQERRA